MPRKKLITADVLSRAPVKHTLSEEEMEHEADLKAFVDSVVQSLPATETRLKQLIREKKSVRKSSVLPVCVTREKSPAKRAVSILARVRTFFHSWRQWIDILSSMGQEMLKILHEDHQDIVKCRARARQSVWWPGMSEHITKSWSYVVSVLNTGMH